MGALKVDWSAVHIIKTDLKEMKNGGADLVHDLQNAEQQGVLVNKGISSENSPIVGTRDEQLSDY